jgi:peptide/nickel transport system permease protein
VAIETTTAQEGPDELPRGDLDSPEVVVAGGVRGWLAMHPLASYALRRFVLYVFTLWAAVSATFVFFHLIPGDPIGAYIQNLQTNHIYNASASQAVVDHYKEVFGLNGSLLQQYGHYLYQLVIKHDLGPSLINYPDSAQVVIGRALPWTMGLLFLSTIIAWVLGVLMGALAGWRRENPVSEIATYVSVAVSHIPFYFVGLLLVFYLSFKLDWFPSGYAYDANLHTGFNWTFISSVIHHGILPALSIVIVGALGNLIGMRQQMVMVLGEDYLNFAHAKGLRPWKVLRRYAIPNCYLPQITGLLISFGFIFNGNVLIEQLFNYPGVGHLLVAAIGQLDYNTVMGITNMSIFVVLTAVFLVDLILPLLDPRIKYSR